MGKKRIVIIGAGNNGKCVADAAEKAGNFEIIGFLDTKKQPGESYFSYPILGNQSEIIRIVDQFNLEGGVVSLGDNFLRYQIVKEIIKHSPNFNFLSIIHPMSVISKGVKVGKGCIIMPGVIINANTKVSNFCLLNTSSVLEHDSEIKDFSTLSPGVITGGHFSLGSFSTMGLGSKALDRVSIGENSFIGAGALVTKNIEDNVLAYGVPAKVIRKREFGEKTLP